MPVRLDPAASGTFVRVGKELQAPKTSSWAAGCRSATPAGISFCSPGFMADADLPTGWLRLLTDERLRPAVSLIHSQPSRPWSLQDLAQAAAMSRTAFAERFREVAGTPPRAYLNNWRMLTAQRALRSGDTRIRALALELGFSSESAFSTAFKRSVGESPLRYRVRMRDQASAN
ncbi:AraC-like DNA-binding protein [Arthrobacter sp. UYP6]|uniref:helix-turn-helix transcriptional regulator n=1 Tax=Arthrobacter sp. UYP6 TaxID=1756378 RepID=UPI00339AEC6B